MGKKNRKLNKIARAEKSAAAPKIAFVDRPFAGIKAELELVAMREIIPAGLARVSTTKEYGKQEFSLVTLLPDGVPALRRADGELLVAVQSAMSSGDASLDLAYAIELALEIEPGQVLTLDTLPPANGVRLQEIIDWSQPFELEVRETFDFWLGTQELTAEQEEAALERLRAETVPSAQVEGVQGAYWCQMNKAFVRWCRSEDENLVLDGLARLQAKRALQVGEDTKFVGAFRALGILVPVWELPDGLDLAILSKSMQSFAPKIEAAIADTQPLSDEERRAKAGIVSRQVTLR